MEFKHIPILSKPGFRFHEINGFAKPVFQVWDPQTLVLGLKLERYLLVFMLCLSSAEVVMTYKCDTVQYASVLPEHPHEKC
jgi:hypothetical protein